VRDARESESPTTRKFTFHVNLGGVGVDVECFVGRFLALDPDLNRSRELTDTRSLRPAVPWLSASARPSAGASGPEFLGEAARRLEVRAGAPTGDRCRAPRG
jgi:hypothetical protein